MKKIGFMSDGSVIKKAVQSAFVQIRTVIAGAHFPVTLQAGGFNITRALFGTGFTGMITATGLLTDN